MTKQTYNQDQEWDVERKESTQFDDREVPPHGAHAARVCAVIDVGTHDASDLKGNPYSRRCLVLGFELSERQDDGTPFYMSKLLTLSLDTKANLTGIVKALHKDVDFGEKFHPGWIAGKGCLLQVSNETKTKRDRQVTYANIDSVGLAPKGFPTPQGGCDVWRVSSGTPIPDTDYLPPIWNSVQAKMWTIQEWAENSYEATGRAPAPVPAAAPASQPTSSRTGAQAAPAPSPRSQKPAQPVTQTEADDVGIPF